MDPRLEAFPEPLSPLEREVDRLAKEAKALHEENARLTRESFVEYFVRQSEWSERTFGHGTRTQGIVEHIRKELNEVLVKPHDLEEWIDLTMLAMDGFWRHGGDPRTILDHLNAKQQKNFARKWKTPTDGHAVEHERESSESQMMENPYGDPIVIYQETFIAKLKQERDQLRADLDAAIPLLREALESKLSILVRDGIEKFLKEHA